jgi:serine protease DegS
MSHAGIGANYMNFKRLLQFAAWPTAVGVIIALLAMLVFPQLRGQQPTNNPAANTPNTGPYSYADAVSRAAPAVVNIYTAKKVLERDPRYYNNPLFRQLFNSSNIPMQERMQRTLGSGVIVDSKGIILTNNHVINGADKIQVLLNDGRYTSAELVGIDSENDLAVLKITLDNLLPISLGQPSSLRVGDVVLAIGNPFGVGQSVSQGIVSALGRWGLGINNRENFIQTDAAINPGNSGGALIDVHGNLIGINTAILDETGAVSVGISFAVPADIAMNSLKQIAEFGEVQRGWLGFTAAPLNDKGVQFFGTLGLIVTGVEEASPAETAGLRREDLIIKVNDISIGEGVFPERNYHAVQNLVGNLKPGSTINFKVLRAGKTVDIKAVAGIRPTQTKT